VSAHVLNQSRSTAQSFLAPSAADADILAIEVEIDLSVRHEVGFLAKPDRASDLTLGGDAYEMESYSYS